MPGYEIMAPDSHRIPGFEEVPVVLHGGYRIGFFNLFLWQVVKEVPKTMCKKFQAPRAISI